MNADVRQAVLTRARGFCECQCGTRVPPGEVDHFMGRAKAKESIENCWVLTVACHLRKTRNEPSAAEWLRKFIAHTERHGYTEARLAAQHKLLWVEAKADASRKVRPSL